MNDAVADRVGPMQNPPHLSKLIRESMDDVGWDVGWGTADHWMRMQASYELAQARRGRAATERRPSAWQV